GEIPGGSVARLRASQLFDLLACGDCDVAGSKSLPARRERLLEGALLQRRELLAPGPQLLLASHQLGARGERGGFQFLPLSELGRERSCAAADRGKRAIEENSDLDQLVRTPAVGER